MLSSSSSWCCHHWQVTGLSSNDLEARVARLSKSSGIKDVADMFVESIVDPVTNTFSNIVNTVWLNKSKGWLGRRRRNAELDPMKNFLNNILHDFDWIFVAANTIVSVLRERNALEAAKIVFIGLLMIANFAIAFTLPFYIWKPRLPCKIQYLNKQIYLYLCFNISSLFFLIWYKTVIVNVQCNCVMILDHFTFHECQ